ncbi:MULTISPECIES: hypothetical protein [Pseudomonas]|uniref:hypothetical protein n=1 Tax=Pseudomonas TaxID=286 RepID=UPI000F0355A0|nr:MULTISPECIES: hypothetical protein [Pseudomonas]MBD8681230.1 hypothetical protein [Pseudomonas sp. CFBP 13719]
MDSNVVNLVDFVEQREEQNAVASVPVAEKIVDSFSCPETDTRYPLLYRVQYPDLAVSEDERLVFTGSYTTVYQLSPRLKGQNAVLAYPRPEMECFFTLEDRDHCWLEIFDLKSASGINGFLMLANRLTQSEDEFDSIHSISGSFGLLKRRDLPENYGRIVYHASQVRDHPLYGQVPFTYIHVLEQDGTVTQGDPVLPAVD